MVITVNGEERRIEDGLSIRQLLEELRVERSNYAVQHNEQLLASSELEATLLLDGDRVEIVQFVGGG